jgi:predicted enzyme related to lactoylglutathione lyase
MNKENPGAWFEIYIDDMDRAKTFYETVLDTTLTAMPMPESEGPTMQMLSFPMTFDKTSGAPGALVKMEGMPAGGSGTIIYFASADCAIEEARIEAAGGTVIQPKMDIGESGFALMATDTEGNTFGVHSMA